MDGYFDLGSYQREITTNSAEAQIWFNRGLNWCYAFHHTEALRCGVFAPNSAHRAQVTPAKRGNGKRASMNDCFAASSSGTGVARVLSLMAQSARSMVRRKSRLSRADIQGKCDKCVVM